MERRAPHAVEANENVRNQLYARDGNYPITARLQS